MQCTRCAGLRVPEIIYEGGNRVLALRCIYCGDVIERVVVLNRQRRRLPHPNRTRTLMYGSDRWRKSRPTMVESHLVSALIPEAVNLARSQSPLFRLEDTRASDGSRTRSERVPFLPSRSLSQGRDNSAILGWSGEYNTLSKNLDPVIDDGLSL
jgi:hypothetical protein